MNILFLSASFYPSIGGVETHVLRLITELERRGHKLTIITEEKEPPKHLRKPSASEAVKIRKADESSYFIHRKLSQTDIYYFKFGQPSFFKKFRIWYYLLRHYSLIKKADVVHCHDVFIWYLPFRFLFPYKKVFTTFHGYEGRFPPVEKHVWIRKMSERLSFGNICVGDFITRWYGTKPDYVVYGGVESEKLVSIKPMRKRKMKIVLVGRLAKDIGVQLYRDALRNLKRKGYVFEFLACGDGDLRHELERYGKVLGFVKNTKDYIKKADFIFASSYLTMLSVMQLGKPVFAVYTNPLKHDYLYSSPFSKYIYIYSSGKDLASSIRSYKQNIPRLVSAQKWANSQTWSHIADMYEQLWLKE